MIIGLVAALAAAVFYGMASILQSTAATQSEATDRLDVKVLARLVVQWRYIGGLVVDLAGFAAAVVALRSLPLFVVQAAVASSVGVTALAATRLLGARITPRERQALGLLVIGLVLLAVAGRPEHATALHEPGPLLVLGSAGVIALAALVLTRSAAGRAGAWLAAGAGAAFGGVGVAARAFALPHPWTHAFGDPLLYALAAHGALATLLFAAALQRTRVTTVAAVTFSVETVVPAVIGVVWLGDRARNGLVPIAVLGFAVTVVAALNLARFAEVQQ